MKNLAILFLILTLISVPRILIYFLSGGLGEFQTNASFSHIILQISIANLPHYHIDNLSDEDISQIELFRYITIGTDVISILAIVVFILYWKVVSTGMEN